MWDPEQLAEIPVIIDRLQAAGDPLGEWLAIRGRLDARDEVGASEARALRRRARALREQLGPRLILADDPRFGRPHAVRELGLLVDVTFAEASAERLAQLLARPDAGLVLRLRLRADPIALRGCIELLLESSTRPLRELSLEVDGDDERRARSLELGEELCARAERIAARLPSLASLSVDERAIPLPYDADALARAEPWSSSRRSTIARALASSDPEQRRVALERLREHGVDGNQLRSQLLAIIQHDPEPRVRQAALAVVPGLGAGAHALIALITDALRNREAPGGGEWGGGEWGGGEWGGGEGGGGEGGGGEGGGGEWGGGDGGAQSR